MTYGVLYLTKTKILQDPFNNVSPEIVFKRDNTVANLLIRATITSEDCTDD